MVPVTSPEYRRGRAPANKGRKFPPEPLSRQEVDALLRACPGRGPCGPRTRALIVLLWRCGLRIEEALALYPKDIDLKLGTVRVLHGKGDQSRLVGIDPQAIAVIESWLAKRAEYGVSGHKPLFCTMRRGHSFGRPLRSSVVRESLKLYAAKAGIGKRVHPHGLRHTHAFELSMEGKPIHLIQLQLGHSSVATTERYIRHIAPAQLVATMQARSWGD